MDWSTPAQYYGWAVELPAYGCFYCIHFGREGVAIIYSFIILKILFVNLFTDVFLIFYYAEVEWFLIYYNCVNFLAVYLSVAFVVFVPGKGSLYYFFYFRVVCYCGGWADRDYYKLYNERINLD